MNREESLLFWQRKRLDLNKQITVLLDRLAKVEREIARIVYFRISTHRRLSVCRNERDWLRRELRALSKSLKEVEAVIEQLLDLKNVHIDCAWRERLPVNRRCCPCVRYPYIRKLGIEEYALDFQDTLTALDMLQQENLQALLDVLCPFYRWILAQRHEGKTLKEISRFLGISKSRVSQYEAKAYWLIRKAKSNNVRY